MPPKKAETRPLNSVEQKLHQACLNASNKVLTQKEVDAVVPDVNARIGAINFLLSVGALKMLQDANKQLSYKGVSKKEIEIKKEMSGDENMVLSQIQASGNQGIWTKHLKAKTELHQTVINRCLKSLEQKGHIKAVSTIKHPTRKIYMMSHLEPSVELTGGPWYSDSELDTTYITDLTKAILRFIQEKSFPKVPESEFSNAAPLYPISYSSSYPTAKMIHNWLTKSRISEQELKVEHIETLLNVLIYDGEIERLPAYGASMWDMSAMDEDSEKETKKKKRGKEKGTKRSKKRSRRDESSDSSDEDKRKKKKRKTVEESDESEDERQKKKAKKRKIKDEGDTSEEEKSGKGKKNKRRKYESDDSESDSESESEEERRKSKKRKPSRASSKSKSKSSRSKSKKKSRSTSSSESEPDDESESNSDSDSDSSSTSRRRKRSASTSSSKRAKSRSKSKAKSIFDVGSDDAGQLSVLDSANVYRAIRQERVSLGLSQAPCCRCPVFEFCSETGPVNPKECTYYGEWLQQGIADFY